MKLWKIVLLILVVTGAFIFFRWTRATDYTNLPPRATGDWIAFGDSLTSGFGASEGNDYPSLLSARLGINIINKGIPGETTQDGLNRLDQILQAHPKVVLLCFGGNDTLRSVPSSQTFANLGIMIDQLHESGSFVVLIGIRSASVFDQNGSRFEKLAEEKKVLYVPDILKGVLGLPSLMSDQIHPNDAGNAVIAEKIDKTLKPVLRKLLQPPAQ